MQKNKPQILHVIAAAITMAFPVSVLAQQAPDAGRSLQELNQQPSIAPKQGATVEIQPPQPASVQPGGQQIVLQSIGFSGNTLFSEDALRAVLGDAVGKSYDFAGLRGLANAIGAYYHAQGYPFARAFLPPQALSEGRLRIEVVEGRYGKVQALGDTRAQRFLSPLASGSVIESQPLERATLLLDDLPGVRTTPIIRPGETIGTGDLDVQVERTAPITGDLGVDNHGNRYTGEHRLRANLQWNSPFLLGDQFSLRTLYTEERMWLGSLGYSLPVGVSGLRLNAGYAHTYYQLAKDFESLDATGTAKVSSLGLSYPLVRSQRSNLAVSLTYQHKRLRDEQGATASDDQKSSNALPISLTFDHRDGVLGGGITYGALAYTRGRLILDGGLMASDTASGQHTAGNFNKINLDVARLQALPAGFTLFGRFSGQWANKNLDSSESFSLGGAYGVRAYPSGEGNADEGWLAQFELRYAVGAFVPYVFHDSGKSRLNANPASLTTPVSDNYRSISGSGLGLRYQRNNWNMDANVAWQNHGGRAQSDTADRNPRVWFTVGYLFN